MLAVNIICVGDQKEKYWREACAEYVKRLSRFCKFRIVEVNESRLPDAPSDADIAKVVASEGERLMKEINKGAADSFVIAMCIEGREMPSEKLARPQEKLPHPPL